MSKETQIVTVEEIQHRIFVVRNKNVLLDSDLAAMYQVETRVHNQAVTRNLERFPNDFMFQLTEMEFKNLKSQYVTSSWGGIRKPPRAFTEQGVAMLSYNLTFSSFQSGEQNNIPVRFLSQIKDHFLVVPPLNDMMKTVWNHYSSLTWHLVLR